jgi:putative phosphoribosyl transferase
MTCKVYQLKFQDRVHAGNILADRLMSVLGNIRDKESIIVIGIPRGGVIIADIVARKLSVDFDIVIGRKLGAPENKELAIGAVMEDGTTYLNHYLVDALRISQHYLEKEKSDQKKEIKRRTAMYRKLGDYKIRGRIVILVDDGIATGATIIAAARWIRRQGSHRLIIAVPVAPPQSVEILKEEADAIEIIASPSDFNAVGEFYENFDPITDEQIIDIMHNRNLL